MTGVDLTADDRRRLATLLREDPAFCDRVLGAIAEHDITMKIASGVTAQNALSAIAAKANEILERFAAVEERRVAWWEQVSGPKGMIAGLIASVTTIATAWIASGGAPHP
jgi:hypothetical protein